MTPRPSRPAQLALALAFATFAMPAHAHALGIGVFVFVVLLAGWPVACVVAAMVAPRGMRGLTFIAAAVLYPATYLMAMNALAFVYRNRSNSALDDAQPIVFVAQCAIWLAAVIWIARRSRGED